MSADMITTLVGVVSILLAFAGCCGWMVRRMDARIEATENKLTARIEATENKLGARIDNLGARIDNVADELVEVKIAIARVEGPPRHLIASR